MKNVRVKVVWQSCFGKYSFCICEGRKNLFGLLITKWQWVSKRAAIHNAKAMAKRIGIPYDPEIIKQHGC